MSVPRPDDHPASGAKPKICVDCDTECGRRPRTRDAQGRYHCQNCLDQLAHERARHGPSPRSAPRSGKNVGGDMHADSVVDDNADGMYDVIPLEVEPLPVEVAGGIGAPGAGMGGFLAGAPGIRPCPICTKPLAQTDAICINCGYNAATGRKAETRHKDTAPKASPGGKCSKCGYAMAGLRSSCCPECGTINLPQDKRSRDREYSKSIARQEYRKPILMFLIGAAAMCVILGTTSDTPGASVLGYLISYAIEVPIGVVVFWLCGIMWIGFDAPFHLTALRLAGIYAVVDVALFVCPFIPFPYLGLFIPAIMYIGFLSEMLDMDMQDALVVGFLTFMTKLGIGILLKAHVLGLI